VSTILVPLLLFVVLAGVQRPGSDFTARFARDLPVMVTVFTAIGGVTSLVAIISIYREGGILKRLRVTPLRPLEILASHVAVKMLLTAVTLGLLALVGRRFYSGPPPPSLASFLLGVVLVLISILSIGFVIASAVPTARFAQPVASMVLYPLFALSGLFFPLEVLPSAWRTLGQASPLAQSVVLLRGLWLGQGWIEHWTAVAALVANFVVCSALASRIFRWE